MISCVHVHKYFLPTLHKEMGLTSHTCISHAQNGIQDLFRFVTFVLQYLTYLTQFVLSLFQEPKSKYSVLDQNEVSGLHLLINIDNDSHSLIYTTLSTYDPHSGDPTPRQRPPSSLRSRGGGRMGRFGTAGDAHSSTMTWLTSVLRKNRRTWPQYSRGIGTMKSEKLGMLQASNTLLLFNS